MFDIFYYNEVQKVPAVGRRVESINQAHELSRTRFFWWITYLVDLDDWDFLWEPPPWQQHQRHAWPSHWQQDSGLYLIPAAGFSDTNYHTEHIISTLPCRDHWWIPEHINTDTIDFTWHPDASHPAYIYHFDTQQHWDHVGGPEYRTPGAVDIKYCSDLVAGTRGCDALWDIPDWIDPDSIDRSWVPNPADPPFVYEFPVEWGWNMVGGPEYRVPGATAKKYHDAFVARTRCVPGRLTASDCIADTDPILRWHPNPAEPPYIYVFGNQHWPAEKRESARYTVPDAVNIKYMDEPRVQRLPQQQHWRILHDCEIDQSWEPDPGDPPYIYVFGNQWWPAEIMPTAEYHVPGALERKFLSEPVARLPSRSETPFKILVECEWDSSWVPDPGDPPYIYVFGNQWHPAEIMPTVEYHVPGAVESKYIDWPRAKLLPDRAQWSVPDEVNLENIDFSWRPDPGNLPYVYHFGSEFQTSVGLTYTVPGSTEIKFAGDIPKLEVSQPILSVMDIFYIDKHNAMNVERFHRLQQKYPQIQRVRYVNSILDTIKRCLAKTKQRQFWVISSMNVYDDFDFAWHAEPWQRSMTHVFGSQWNKWSDTFLINRWEFERHASWAKGIEEFPNLNFVTDQTVTAPADGIDLVIIDFANPSVNKLRTDLESRCRVLRTVRYFDNYLDTFRRLLPDLPSTIEHLWVIGSVCDYSRFDFSWQPEAWQRDMLHVFPSNDQKFGDTFYVPVMAMKEKIQDLELLDWFETVNYCNDQSVPRLPMPIMHHDHDSHVQALPDCNFQDPFIMLTVNKSPPKNTPTISLWREKTKTIVPLDPGAESVVLPRNAITHIRSQFYDYPYIDKNYRHTAQSTPQDVVFISYDETNADENWQRLQDLCPRAQRLHGVSGMEKALEAAADLSQTAWYYAVFAKTEVYQNFKFDFVPDRMQAPKHYIFNCRNMVNDLEYGHMGIVLYNCAGIRQQNQQKDFGLDYTLSFPHESVPILSCLGRFNQSPYETWRTAFRETAKLAYFESQQATVEGAYRLEAWQNQAQGDYAEWCLRGAKDGIEFFKESGGDLAVLKHSFRWEWLQQRFQQSWDLVD